MARCGTYYGYRCGCRCAECRAVNAAAKRRYRNRQRNLPVDTRLKPGPAPAAKPRPAFDTNLTNLEHAWTIEEWRKREAANPGCLPITQGPIRLRCEALAEVHPTPSLVDRYVDGAQ
jgi:hypothetical protein